MGIKKQVGKTSISVGKKNSRIVLNSRTLRATSRLTKLALAGGSGTAVHLNHHSKRPDGLVVSCSIPSSGDRSLLASETSGNAFFMTKLLTNDEGVYLHQTSPTSTNRRN